MTGRRTVMRTLLLALVLAMPTPRVHAQAVPSPSVLAALEGRWDGTGTILGQPSRVQMEWTPALDARFVRLTFVSHIGPEPTARRVEGHACYQPVGDGRYRATWFDSSGLVRPIAATSASGTLVAVWGRAETEEGETTYLLTSPDRMEVVDRVKSKDGTWRVFGRSTLSRTTERMTEPPGDVSPVPPAPPAYLRPPLPAGETPAEGPPPLPFTPSASSVDLSPRPFRFTGTPGERFRIWIVNLLLSVVTLGIYSAWAKVRRLRYFYGHTSLDGRTFGYHASPIAILKGRLIAYAVVIVLAVLGNVAPLAASVLYLPLLMVMPIVLVRAFRFRAANSSYGGIRFGFDGLESESYRVFLFLPITVPFTLGLTYPYVTKRQREFFVGDSRHGRSQFGLELPTWHVYRIYLLAGLAALVAVALGSVLLVGASPRGGAVDPDARPGPEVILAVLMLYAGFGLIVVGVRVAFENLVWNHTWLDRHRFDSRLRIGRMLWLYATNAVAILVTLGLAVPWARIRMARYRAESLTLVPGGPLVTAELPNGLDAAATSAELSDAMDLDFGL